MNKSPSYSNSKQLGVPRGCVILRHHTIEHHTGLRLVYNEHLSGRVFFPLARCRSTTVCREFLFARACRFAVFGGGFLQRTSARLFSAAGCNWVLGLVSSGCQKFTRSDFIADWMAGQCWRILNEALSTPTGRHVKKGHQRWPHERYAKICMALLYR